MEIWIVKRKNGTILCVVDSQEKANLRKGDSDEIEILHTWVR